jgi:hypothetical protein
MRMLPILLGVGTATRGCGSAPWPRPGFVLWGYAVPSARFYGRRGV